ncbi:MAG TPA: hypothetical protein VJU14_07435 [Solirubrobacterales bacterium]|nr:hypothetical protein [Solirubrobacterales bacterium]
MLELAREIQELMEEEARSALEAGWAELTIAEVDIGPSLHLEPVRLECAPLEVYFDSAQLVICSPGRKGMSCEFFSEVPGGVKDRVLALSAAVVAGEYEERMRKGSSELVASWPGPTGREEAVREALVTSGFGSGVWTTISYEPY